MEQRAEPRLNFSFIPAHEESQPAGRLKTISHSCSVIDPTPQHMLEGEHGSCCDSGRIEQLYPFKHNWSNTLKISSPCGFDT
ncbi:MAG: hypothetical protein ACI81V_000975 [Lentimonas sp.]|jgi:hypothetical protein